jgi:DNA-binding transcriptional regulator YiaG
MIVERRTEDEPLDPATTRMVRDLLRGRDGEVRLRFRVDGEIVSMDVIDPHAASKDRSESVGKQPSFASWIGDLLRTRSLSQEATARAVGVSLKTVNRWVNGRTEPRMRELRRIQEAFGVAPPL